MKFSLKIFEDLQSRKDLSIDEEISLSILNFIRVIHLNQQDFVSLEIDSKYYGQLPMTFKKKPGQVIGGITAAVDGEIRRFVFTDQGYEPLEDLSIK